MDKEEKPLLDKKDEKKDPDSSSSDGSYASSSNYSIYSKDSQGDPKEFDTEKFIWRRSELDSINKGRPKKDVIPVVYRSKYSNYGIRAYPDLGFWKSLFSTVIPWTNEFVSIWLNIIFAIYFWIEMILIMEKGKEYEFNNDNDYFYAFIAVFFIASYLTITAIYLIFYSMGGKYNETLQVLVYMAQVSLAFAFTFCFMASELEKTDDFFPVLFIIAILYAVVMVLGCYDGFGKTLGFWLTVGILSTIVFFDLCLNSNKHRIKVMYVPLIIEGLILGIGIVLLVFQVPERFCSSNKILNLYCTSYIIFTLFLINFLFEALNILYYTEKLNSFYLDDDDEWWKVKNIYNTKAS